MITYYDQYIMVGAITVISIVLFIIGAVLFDEYKSRKYDRIKSIKDLGIGEVKEITRQEAEILIKEKFPKDRRDIEMLSLNLGDHYFLFRSSYEGWLEKTGNIKNKSLLVAKDFKLKYQLESEYINYSSRILIFKENLRRQYQTQDLIVRRVWAIGSVVTDEKQLLIDIFDREEFKSFLDANESITKSPNELGTDFLKNAELSNIFKYENVFVAMRRTISRPVSKEKEKLTFSLYEASDCYQVVTKIEDIL